MNKNKWKSNKGLKITLVIISILMAAVAACSVAAVVFMAELGIYERPKSETLEDGYKRYCDIYTVMALANRDSDAMKESLNQTNFRYGIVKADDLNQVDISSPASYEYYNFETMPKKDAVGNEEAVAYQFEIGPNTAYAWDCSLFGFGDVYEQIVEDYDYAYAEESSEQVTITGYYYNVSDGFFYYETDEEYYRVDTVELPVGTDGDMVRFVYDSGQKAYYQLSREGLLDDYYVTFDKYDDTASSWETWDNILLDNWSFSHIDIRFVDDKTSTMEEFNGKPIADHFYALDDGVNVLRVKTEESEQAVNAAAEKNQNESYWVVCQVREPLQKTGDLFNQLTVVLDYAYAWRYIAIAALVISSILWIVTTLLVLIMAGHKGSYEPVAAGQGNGYREDEIRFADAVVRNMETAGGSESVSIDMADRKAETAGIRGAGDTEAEDGKAETGAVSGEKSSAKTESVWVDAIKPGFWQRIPLDVETCIVMIIGGLAIAAAVEMTYHWNHIGKFCIFMACLLVGYLVSYLWLADFVIRVKSGKWWRSMLLYKFVMWIWRKLKKVLLKVKDGFVFLQKNISLLWKAILILGGVSLLEFFGILMTGWSPEAELAIWLPYRFATVALIFVGIVQANKLKEGAKRLAEGDLQEKVKTEKMFWEFKEHGNTLNSIGDGIGIAVEKRMQSEHFRTELITNVSHDIKTPLTSIINYVDLLQKEEIDNEKAKEYLEVLSRQSARLKKLTEDLLEASKASTGSLAVQLEKLELGVFLTQTVGEFEEKIQAAGLHIVMHKPEQEVFVNADGKHLWRVVENLVQNICKYAQPDTRVYIDLDDREKEAVISFKNISRYELNVSGEELMERFVRGDASRHTEGSGLGLSIAESLMVLMRGRLEIVVDGDLFKVVLHFPK